MPQNKNLQTRIIGKVCSAHGIKGEIKIYPLMNSSLDFENIKKININDQEFHIEKIKNAKQLLILKLKGINTRNEAESLSGYVSADLAEDLEEDEFFIEDLFKLKVLNENDEELGEVCNVSEAGQIKLFVKPKAELNKKNQLIIPFVENFIDKINIQEGFIKIKESSTILDLNS